MEIVLASRGSLHGLANGGGAFEGGEALWCVLESEVACGIGLGRCVAVDVGVYASCGIGIGELSVVELDVVICERFAIAGGGACECGPWGEGDGFGERCG